MKVRLVLPVLLVLLLAAVALVGGASLLDAQSGPGLGFAPQVFVVRSDGSGLRQLTKGEGPKSHPTWSPDGRRLAYVDRGIRVLTLSTGKARRLSRSRRTGAASAAWSPRRDELVYLFRSGDEEHPRSHLARLGADGRRFKRLASWKAGRAGTGDPVWSPDGKLIAYARERASRKQSGDVYCICGPTNVAVVSRRATGDRLFELPGDELYPSWSPDGTWILFALDKKQAGFGLWKISPRGRRLQRVGPKIVNAYPSWSHDGTRVAFTGHSDTGARDQALFVLEATPAGVPRLIAEHVGGSAWSPVENAIAFTDFDGHVRVTTPDASGQRTLATFAPDTEFQHLSWSSDGRWLAFTAAKQRPSD
jgi:Tol biopolymer transport system component